MSNGTIYNLAAKLYAECRADFVLILMAHAEEALEATAGNLLSPRAVQLGYDVETLLELSGRQCWSLATEELRVFWRDHPRPEFASFQRQWVFAHVHVS